MNSFKSNKIVLELDALAEELRQARINRGLRLDQVAARLNINQKYLAALEAGDFNQLPAGVYGKNFLKEYAQFLKLDYKKFLEIFENNLSVSQVEQKRGIFSKQVASPKHFLIVPKIIKAFVLLIIVVACLYYLNFLLEKIVAPPRLIINQPAPNLITKNKSVTVRGLTEAEAEILINGETIISQVGGQFFKEVELKDGLNIITITAQKKYSEKKTEVRQILVEP